jgi:hypothetical protein
MSNKRGERLKHHLEIKIVSILNNDTTRNPELSVNNNRRVRALQKQRHYLLSLYNIA